MSRVLQGQTTGRFEVEDFAKQILGGIPLMRRCTSDVHFTFTPDFCGSRIETRLRLDTITMRKINTKDIAEELYDSPKGKFGGGDKEISIALGRKPSSTDLMERHPFDVEISRIPPGKALCPYHAHSAQWEFYHVISGNGLVRHQDGTTEIESGDAFIFEPGQPHKLTNNGSQDLIILIVADNPIGESCYYPDTDKCLVRSPESRLMRSEPLDYFDGEE